MKDVSIVSVFIIKIVVLKINEVVISSMNSVLVINILFCCDLFILIFF